MKRIVETIVLIMTTRSHPEDNPPTPLDHTHTHTHTHNRKAQKITEGGVEKRDIDLKKEEKTCIYITQVPRPGPQCH